MKHPEKLTPRERQVVQILASRGGGATAGEIRSAMTDAPSYSAVRALLKVMENKNLLTHRQEGPRYVYESLTPPKGMRRSALKEILRGFFGGSRTALAETLFDPSDGHLSEEEIEQLSKLIEKARKQKENDA